ncbi:MAG: Fe-S cluster assembly protein SufD [Candidatus Liberibacter ctenarytainae]|uniref:Fe-S cluster assembly protein SufD n=1 Tax=Candidatus Liberibacter ctenarytainae TaxID=2020335 RepID=A0A937AJ65_9HYPH|nr:Fe-S cluster assembly protein SufD [Candidatus Liberibacter ctenarytainae]
MNKKSNVEHLTAAETMLIQACDAACQEQTVNQELTAFKSRLLHDFRAEGLLPTRRIEDWHYTDLKRILKIFPANKEKSSVLEKEYDCLVEGSIKLLIGRKIPCSAQEKNIRVYDFSHKEEKSLYLEPLKKHDVIGYINAILVKDGYRIEIPDGCHLDVPLELQSVQSGGQMNLRYSIQCGINSKATIVERYITSQQYPSFVSSIAEIKVCSGAEVVWVIVQEQGAEDTHLGQVRVFLERNASLKIFVIHTSEGLVRREVFVDVEGEESKVMLRGINLLKGTTHHDLSVFLNHKEPNSHSTTSVRNIVLEKSTGVFQAKISVSAKAQGSNANMTSRTLLRSDEGNFFVKPELEIFADDVLCGHGATTSDINQNHLYYLMMRGIPEKKAYLMLSHAFVSEVIADLEDELLQSSLEKIISAWMNKSFMK